MKCENCTKYDDCRTGSGLTWPCGAYRPKTGGGMDIEKLIEQLRTESLYADKASLEIMDLCMDAATALSTLQTENEKLKDQLYDGEGVNLVNYWMQQAKIEENGHRNCQAENEKLRAELEQVKLECDAAQSLLAEQIGVRGAEPITTVFGLPLDRLRELAQADRDGRCVVLPEGECEDKDGENALKSAMNTCFYHNNPVTRYIADAVAEKLTREADKAALRGDQHGKEV